VDTLSTAVGDNANSIVSQCLLVCALMCWAVEPHALVRAHILGPISAACLLLQGPQTCIGPFSLRLLACPKVSCLCVVVFAW